MPVKVIALLAVEAKVATVGGKAVLLQPFDEGGEGAP